MKKLPPPTNVNTLLQESGELPDYLAGHLIYFDPDNGCKWVVYDGNKQHRFTTRRAAERFVIARATHISDEELNVLFLAQYRCRSMSDAIGRIYATGRPDELAKLTAVAVKLRALSDDLDGLCAYFLTTKKK